MDSNTTNSGSSPPCGSTKPGHSFVVVYGMACTCRCDFCCHDVERYGPIRLRPEQAIDWIRQASGISSIGSLVFTGGEPFLYYRDLLQILESSPLSEMTVRIVTSAHWADSAQTAMDKLKPLRERGLTQLSISTDPSHQKFVPAAHAEHAARAALELGLVTELAGVFWDPDTQLEDVVRVPEGATTHRSFAIPIGPGPHPAVDAQSYRMGPERLLGCGDTQELSLTVYPDGKVYPCCSGGFNIAAGLDFGDLNRDPLAEILRRIADDRFVRVVTELGLGCIYELISFKWPELRERLPEHDSCIAPCELCARVHVDRELMDVLQPVLHYADQLLTAWTEVRDSTPRHPPEVPRA